MLSGVKAVEVVCVSVGAGASPLHVERLRSMLGRHLPGPFNLWCVVDRPQPLPDGVRSIDASGWTKPRPGMRPTVVKLGLFDPEAMPIREFLYFDTSLVIQRDLSPLLAFTDARPEELVAVRDWTYDAFNTCVMRVRTGGSLAEIPRVYAQGVAYDQKTPGDQDFVSGFVRERGLESCVATFPPEMVASYKMARAKARAGRAGEGREDLERALAVKFHGKPKMDEILDPWTRFLRLRLMKPLTGRVDATFWVRELQERWR